MMTYKTFIPETLCVKFVCNICYVTKFVHYSYLCLLKPTSVYYDWLLCARLSIEPRKLHAFWLQWKIIEPWESTW